MCLPVEREKRKRNYAHSCGSPWPYMACNFPRVFFIYPLPIFLVNQVYASNGNGCLQQCFLLWFPSGQGTLGGQIKYTLEWNICRVKPELSTKRIMGASAKK